MKVPIKKFTRKSTLSLLFFFSFFIVIYSGGDNLPEKVDVEFKSIFDNVKPTVLKNIGSENSSYSLIGTGE